MAKGKLDAKVDKLESILKRAKEGTEAFGEAQAELRRILSKIPEEHADLHKKIDKALGDAKRISGMQKKEDSKK